MKHRTRIAVDIFTRFSLSKRVPATPRSGLARRRCEEERTRNGWRELGFPEDMWPAFLDGISIRCQSTAAANFLVKLLSAFNAFLRYSTFRYVKKKDTLAGAFSQIVITTGMWKPIQRIPISDRIWIINRWTTTKKCNFPHLMKKTNAPNIFYLSDPFSWIN